MKKLLSIVETTDEELANKEEQEDAPMISAVVFTNFEWSIIKKLRLQAKVLNLIESDFMHFGIDSSFESVRYLLDDLKTKWGFSGVEGMESLAHELSKAKMKFLILESVVSTLSF